MKIANRSCRTKVQARSPFQCHGSLYGTHVRARDGSEMYVVYSYGTHWPLFVWHGGAWYENSDRRSVTTSKHRSQAHPHCDTIPAPCDALKAFIEWGLERCPKIDRLVAVSA